MKVLIPLSSQLNAAHDQADLRRLYLTGTRVTLTIFMPIGCSVELLAGPFLNAWIGAGYAQYVTLVYLLVAASFKEILIWPAGAVLQGISKHQILAPIAIGSGIVKLIATILLVRPYRLYGVALGTLLPNGIGDFILCPALHAQNIGD